MDSEMERRYSQRMREWARGLEKFALPDWEGLPQLELYMDQIIILLTEYLAPVSIINNYVRMKIVPPPVKKKYSRVHIAFLVVICTLKRSLSISSIQRLLPEDRTEESVRAFYNGFVRQYRDAVEALCAGLSSGRLVLENTEVFGSAAAIFSVLAKDLTEYLLWGDEEDIVD